MSLFCNKSQNVTPDYDTMWFLAWYWPSTSGHSNYIFYPNNNVDQFDVIMDIITLFRQESDICEYFQTLKTNFVLEMKAPDFP